MAPVSALESTWAEGHTETDLFNERPWTCLNLANSFQSPFAFLPLQLLSATNAFLSYGLCEKTPSLVCFEIAAWCLGVEVPFISVGSESENSPSSCPFSNPVITSSWFSICLFLLPLSEANHGLFGLSSCAGCSLIKLFHTSVNSAFYEMRKGLALCVVFRICLHQTLIQMVKSGFSLALNSSP